MKGWEQLDGASVPFPTIRLPTAVSVNGLCSRVPVRHGYLDALLFAASELHMVSDDF